MTTLPEIGSLWIGERLSILEILCLKSFVDRGHKLTLFSYGGLQNPPDFCEVRDAREIWDDDDIVSHKQKSSPAIHSDIFRIKMIRQTGMIWADADAYCLRPFIPIDGYLIGFQHRYNLASGVIGMPQTSPALKMLDEFLSTKGAFPPWWTDAQISDYEAKHGAPDFSKMKWGSTGPQALSHFARETGEIERGVPQHVLYPIPQPRKTMVFRRARHAMSFIKEDTMSVHFYASGIRERLDTTWFSAKTYLGQLCLEHGLDITPPPGHPVLNKE